jgi:hypothetical protein
MAPSLRRGERLPAPVRRAVSTASGERVLSSGRDATTDAHVVATNQRVVVVSPAGEVLLDRPWHDVDAGTWSSELQQLTVTWVDGSRPAQWSLGAASMVPETLRERVQASVVLAHRVDLGPRRNARVVIRQDLASGALLEQVVTGRGVRADDPEVEAATQAALADLREQVGLD